MNPYIVQPTFDVHAHPLKRTESVVKTSLRSVTCSGTLSDRTYKIQGPFSYSRDGREYTGKIKGITRIDTGERGGNPTTHLEFHITSDVQDQCTSIQGPQRIGNVYSSDVLFGVRSDVLAPQESQITAQTSLNDNGYTTRLVDFVKVIAVEIILYFVLTAI